MSESKNDTPQYEICVACGEMTDVLWDTPIDCRRNYVHGCGQLCEKCGDKLERENQPKTTELKSGELERLMHSLRKGKGD